MTSTISISASVFASGITGTEDINYVTIFNPNNSRLSDDNKNFLSSDDFKQLKESKSNDLKEWKKNVVTELKKKITVVGEPSGNSTPIPTSSPVNENSFVKNFAGKLNAIDCSFVDLTNPKHKIHSNDSRLFLEKIKEMEKDEKRKFLLSVCAELSKKGVSVTLWNGTIFSSNHSNSMKNNISSTSISVKDNDMNNSIELVIFISKLKDLGFEDDTAEEIGIMAYDIFKRNN